MKKWIFLVACLSGGIYNMAAQVRVNDAGKVGIGTTVPSKQLHVNGDTYIENGNLGVGVLNPAEKIHIDGDIFLTYGSSLWIGNNSNSGNRLRLHQSGNQYGGSGYIDYKGGLFLRAGTSTYFTFTNSGYMGIHTTYPHYKLDVNGIMRASGYVTASDIRLKENIKRLSNQKEKLQKLEAITYTLKDSVSPIVEQLSDTSRVNRRTIEKSLKKRNQFGFSAQDLQKVYPELVFEDSLGFLSVNYLGLVPILVEAVKELQVDVESLILKTVVTEDETKVKLHESYLSQTVSTKFNENVKIEYFLDEAVKKALICIYDLNGTQLKYFELSHLRNGYVILGGGELVAGMYRYALITDGQCIESKTMVLTN